MTKSFHSQILPVVLVFLIAVLVAMANIIPGTYLSGWDNMHPEFNLANYAHQVTFGAWLEHEGTGGPAAQVLSANVFRLPWLWLLQILPDSYERYAFVFLMYVIGGVGMYLYLKGHWLPKKTISAQWIAGLGAVYYLLNPLTLQQFYIIFEMFAVQFAFLPFLLISLHLLHEKQNMSHWFYFCVMQLLISPSAYQPLVFYLGLCFLSLYLLFLGWRPSRLIQNFRLPVLAFLVAFFLNSYWIIPNLYFTFAHADYISEGKANSLFRQESLWSVRSSGDWQSLLTGVHYLFDWQDFDFSTKTHEFIFSEWRAHFSQGLPVLMLIVTSLMVWIGLLTLPWVKSLGTKRGAVFGWFLLSVVLVWADLLPTRGWIEAMYRNSAVFFEIFRNPFTKFNVLLSFVWTIGFTQFLVLVFERLHLSNFKLTFRKSVSALILGGISLAVMVMMSPVFSGQLINEKLRIQYPYQYENLREYLKQKDRHLRVLELPYYSFEGFEYYDWQHLRAGNGYQGLGFQFFGFPQAMLTPDFARWTESTDDFYTKLRFVLDGRNGGYMKDLLSLYQVDLVILDTSKIDSHSQGKDINYETLLSKAGLNLVWHEDFLMVYERTSQSSAHEGGVFVPYAYRMGSSSEARTYADETYFSGSHLVSGIDDSAHFPLTGLLKEHVFPVVGENGQLEFPMLLPEGRYQLSHRLLESDVKTPMMLSFDNQVVSVTFLRSFLINGDQRLPLPGHDDAKLVVGDVSMAELLVGEEYVRLSPQEKRLVFVHGDSVTIKHISPQGREKEIYASRLDAPSWLSEPIDILSGGSVALLVQPLWFSANLLKPTINCDSYQRGSIATDSRAKGVEYRADDFGVNCASEQFGDVSSRESFLVWFSGENSVGRSIKLFVNDSRFVSFTKQLIFPQGQFSNFYTIPGLPHSAQGVWLFNWETRSYGEESVNRLHAFMVSPLPIFELSSMSFSRSNASDSSTANQLVIDRVSSFDPAILTLDYSCLGPSCVFGVDQSYDDGWVAIDLNTMDILPHLKIDGWSNGWQLSGKGKVLVFYVFELVSLFLLGGVFLTISFMVYKILSSKKGAL